MNKTLTDIVAGAMLVWVTLTLILNFLIPTSIFFEYESLVTSDVCVGENHRVEGNYWARFNIPAEGVDHIVSADTEKRKDRYPWDKGMYKAGHNQGGWMHTADLVPGNYRIESTELRLNLLRIFPIYLNEDERPVSNTFKVVECK